MGRFSDFSRNASSSLKSFKEVGRERSREIGHRILKPKKFEKYEIDGGDRVLQILALCILPVVIIVSLVFIVAINETMSEVFGITEFTTDGDQSILGWFITAVTGGLFLLAAWVWFQFVRTSGFGAFKWDK